MRHQKITIPLLLLICVVLSGFSYASGSRESVEGVERYRYPIDVNSEDWFSYSVLEKSEMLRISQEVLDGMSDLQLIYAIADYPYFIDAYIYGFDKDGLSVFAEYCSAFNEFISRDTFMESLASYGKAVAEVYASDQDNVLNFCRAYFVLDLMTFYDLSHEPMRDTPITVYTPNGTPVQASIKVETHSPDDELNYHWWQDFSIQGTYAVDYIAGGTCIYNCHAYAWSYPSPSCPYWIENPANYMSDGSYDLAYSGLTNVVVNSYGVGIGDKVFYPHAQETRRHSAILAENANSTTPLGSLKVISKWGNNGLYKHAITCVPSGCQSAVVSIWQEP